MIKVLLNCAIAFAFPCSARGVHSCSAVAKSPASAAAIPMSKFWAAPADGTSMTAKRAHRKNLIITAPFYSDTASRCPGHRHHSSPDVNPARAAQFREILGVSSGFTQAPTESRLFIPQPLA